MKYSIDKSGEVPILIYGKRKYKIYSDGKIENDRKQIMNPWDNGKGYKVITLHSTISNRKNVYVHRIVAEVYIKNNNPNLEVNHKDGNKSNNSIENLEWVTRIENNRHAWNSGLCEKLRERVSIPVIQKTMQGEVIKIWSSSYEAARSIGCTGELIQMAAKKVCKTGKGFIWDYVK